jgi:hypothetical protein
MMNDLLHAAANSSNDDDDVFVNLLRAEWNGNSIELAISIHENGITKSNWSVLCHDVRRMSLNEVCVDRLKLLSDHVLLWPHTLPQIELYYRGRPTDRLAALGAVLEAHRSLVADWFEFEYFQNRLIPSMQHFDGESGKFADGPDLIIHAYARALEGYGIVTSSPPSRMPKWWNGGKWVDETEPLHVLLLGRSFIVAPRFDAEMISDAKC